MILSSKDEAFEDHVQSALDNWSAIKSRIMPGISRLFQDSIRLKELDELIRTMIAFHDIGKLTKKWQDEIKKPEPRPPPHSIIGAAYLWKMLSNNEYENTSADFRFASSFAVNIHHIDRGIVGENTERPHVQLVLYRLVDDRGFIRWCEEADSAISNICQIVKRDDCLSLSNLVLDDVELMAEDLRKWSRGVGILERHRRRMLASSLHHILKLCDLRAARNRSDLKNREISPLVMKFVEGGLLP